MKTILSAALALPLALTLPLASTLSAAHAETARDVADWALPQTIGALTFRGADSLADRLDTLEKRFGAAPRVAEAAKRLRAWRAEDVGPWARSWGAGLDLGAGLAVFVDGGQRVRLVVGSTDAAAARKSLARWFERLELTLTPTADGFEGPVKLSCAQRGGFLVCDSRAVPEAPDGGDPSLAGAWLAARVSGPLMAMLPAPLGLWAEHFELRVDEGEAGPGLAYTLKTREDARPQLDPLRAMLLPSDGDSPLRALDRRSGALMKLSVDGAAVMQAIAPDDPEAKALADRIGGLWSGDVLATFVGGLGDPVLALGLRKGADGEALIDALIELMREADLAITRRSDGAGRGALIIRAVDEEEVSVTLRYHAAAGQLAFGFEAIDLDRAFTDDPPPPGMPPAFGRRGVHGIYVAHLPNGLGTLPDIIDFAGADARFATALLTIAQLELRLIDGLALWVEPGPDTVRVELRAQRL